MKIPSSVLNCIFLFAVFFSFLLNFQIPIRAWGNSSTNTQFQQSILPVRFIYVDDQEDIVKVFNNVVGSNTQYVIKFFNADNEQEIGVNPGLLSKYQEFINNVDISETGFSTSSLDNKTTSQDGRPMIELINSPQGLQEIHTII